MYYLFAPRLLPLPGCRPKRNIGGVNVNRYDDRTTKKESSSVMTHKNSGNCHRWFFSTVFLIALSALGQEYSGNPLFDEVFTADPCALVYNDTLYVFTGHDEQTEWGNSFLMRDWYIFSTADMVHWTNHGAVLGVEDFSWASGNAFAGHVVEFNGKFWWYVSLTHESIKVGEGFGIGVAVADHPLGPYKDVTGEALITDHTPNSVTLNIDPAVYIDDGTPWLFWGSWGDARMVKLKTNMTELDGTVQTVNARDFFEAAWVHKKDDLYYLSYASGYPSTTKYSTSTSINGPWTYRGVINDLLPVSETNHQAIIEFRGNWYFIYHNSALPGGGVYRRSVCIDKLEYNEDGTIKKVVRTTTGVPALASTSLEKTIMYKTNNRSSDISSTGRAIITAPSYDLKNNHNGNYLIDLLGNSLKHAGTLSPGIYIRSKKRTLPVNTEEKYSDNSRP